jgi:hypothetical protein
MTDLSKSEIIKKYPIGRRLDAFRDAFSSTFAGLNVHKSPDAVHEGKILELPGDSSNVRSSQKPRARPVPSIAEPSGSSLFSLSKWSRNHSRRSFSIRFSGPLK